MSLNPGLLTLGVLNARSVRNKGPLLADMVASNDLDFLCLTETHIRSFDFDSFIRSVTPPDFIFPRRPRLSGIGRGVSFFIRSSHRPNQIESPSTSHLRIWWCQSGFMAVHCCLPASTALQDHVPVTFWNNSCHLVVSCHLLTLHTISVVISTFMLMFQLVIFKYL